ncbi:hypothetical protein [Dysgonomonas sp. ZJ279]|uniref:hypothetical protein n=1 Tax=Dysgonomonas sp. ZJ279 TaxID=2709796 RepID=UPI0013E9DC74|nr:hypothetical protein [Dysgonomonas sp. ZJ279]
MTHDQQLKTLKSKKARKEQLREALAASLGVPYEMYEKKSNGENASLFTECRNYFLEAYKDHTGVDYVFGAKDGFALTMIIDKVQCLIEYKSPSVAFETFKAFISKLPDWYKQNAFSLTIINNKFNEIIASIRNNGKTGVNDDYKARLTRDLAT